MEKVKQFIEDFVKAEAKMSTLKMKTNLAPYNEFLDEYYSFFVKMLKGGMGHMKKKEWSKRELKALGDIDSRPPCSPRHFFKLSQYKHDIYGDVWVAYVSGESPDLDFKDLTRAFFVIKEDEKLAIARFYSYSKASTNGLKYKWDGREGHHDLTFESLKGPDKIERYLEPDEMFDGLTHYHAEM